MLCDEHRGKYVTAELLYCTPGTNKTLHVNLNYKHKNNPLLCNIHKAKLKHNFYITQLKRYICPIVFQLLFFHNA